MKIKMYHVSNLEKFMELVSQCKGNVYVVSEDGDKLNLKSKLTPIRSSLQAVCFRLYREPFS